MQYREEIHNYIQNRRDEIVETLKELVRIPSVRGNAEEGAPYGLECARVLEFVEQLYKNNDFEAELDNEGGYVLSYFGEGDKTLGFFAHADVVPVGNDWIYTEPFEPIEKDGWIIGRGTLDDKSAVLISLYCAKILKELNIPFNSRLVMFTGSNEESGMGDIKKFISSHIRPDFSLVADTAFPLYRGNKGRIVFYTECLERLPDGVNLNCGTGTGVIGQADIKLPYSDELYSEIMEHAKEGVTIECEDKYIIVKANGIPCHAALPQLGVCALARLTKVLGKCESLDKINVLFKNLHQMSSCHYGECFEIESEDEYGKLTCVLTKLETVNGKLKANFNIRYGDSMGNDKILSKIRQRLIELKWTEPQGVNSSFPDKLSVEDKYVNALLKTFGSFFGVKEVSSYINAGGTYRQYLHSAVETGTTSIWGTVSGMPAGHGGAHQPDECINIEGLLQAIELNMHMLLEADRISNEGD